MSFIYLIVIWLSSIHVTLTIFPLIINSLAVELK